MIQAHVTDAWMHPTERATAAFRYLTVLGGFAAPLFLWLAGLSLVLAGEAVLRKSGDVGLAWRQLVKRGLEIFVLAFLFRANSFLFNPGGAAITLFRVDILNVMGPALVLTGLLWAPIRSRTWHVLLFGTTAVAVAMLTPVVRAAGWVDLLPTWCQWYLRPAGEHTVFTLFPWAGFAFAGAASGAVWAAGRDSETRTTVQLAVAGAGVCVLVLGLYTATLPTIYRESSYWTSSPTFFAVRSGILLIFIGLSGVIATVTAGRLRLTMLQRLGRASLPIYWIHVQVAYGWVTFPLHKRLNLWQLGLAYVLFCAAMYALVPLWDRLKAYRQAHRGLSDDQPSIASA